ncbi:Zn(II)2Cys6 transcription factor domain-containing protein [Aspergillus homomorphus CBS 101889]|uniref:Zn(2)-C6 fungal-type domain-containing protein n=1 Tax=Aspergillus homomorphus (strain CBS 101889) TaxID=1450537 RepID=A0A395HHH5_ASPHC|nr:hypothetical protein BO97DRAFT_22864 [Aspergillus homomorphus CBS 101889]RAL06615.1 hypothetical protein BO97DRAFT_22864 [Aspergillus homomorphus CBS 101889]
MAKISAFRPLLPADSTPSSQSRSENGSNSAQSRRSSACFECRKKRVKCVGSSPCHACARSGSACIFDPSKDRRRKSALISAERSTQRYKGMLTQLIRTLMFDNDEKISALKEFVRDHASVEGCLKSLELKYQSSSSSENRIADQRLHEKLTNAFNDGFMLEEE